MTTEDTAALV